MIAPRFQPGEAVLVRGRVKVDAGDRVKVWIPSVGGDDDLCVVPAEVVEPRPPAAPTSGA